MMNFQLLQDIKEIVGAHIAWNYTQTLTKYSYIDQWAFDFIRFIQNPSYLWYQREIQILENIDLSYWYDQIIDLGPGNGVKWLLLMKGVSDNLKRYIAIDMSYEMLTMAQKQQRDRENIEKQYIQGDFDSSVNIQPHIQGRSLIAILWNTITNVVDIQTYLRDLYGIINDHDMLLLWVEVSNIENIHHLIDEYTTVENRILTFRPLEYIGVPQTAGNIDIIFNQKTNRIEEWFSFHQEICVDGIYIPESAKILLSITNKPTLHGFIIDIQKSWFYIKQIYNKYEQYIVCIGK